MYEIRKWCDTVTSHVRFWPDRWAITQELEAHYEDHKKDLERIGYERDLAAERALTAMGDATEVGKAMDRAHKPWLGWLWLASKWTMLLCIAAALLMLFAGSWQNTLRTFLEPAPRSGDYEPDGYAYFGDAWEQDASTRIMLGKGTSTVERDGDVFSIPYAAVWKCHYPGDGTEQDPPYDSYWLTVVLAADDKNPFDARLGDFFNSLKLTYDDGRFYTEDYGRYVTEEHPEGVWGPGDGFFRFHRSKSDPFRTLYYSLSYSSTPPGEWSELSCPLGEPWSIRIEWEEVEPCAS